MALHNIPEGVAVGVVYAGYLAGNPYISASGALALALGIAAPVFIHLVFYKLLRVPLPDGLLPMPWS